MKVLVAAASEYESITEPMRAQLGVHEVTPEALGTFFLHLRECSRGYRKDDHPALADKACELIVGDSCSRQPSADLKVTYYNDYVE